jgi:3'(2'), 5'-bisphosphate nucleotidase
MGGRPVRPGASAELPSRSTSSAQRKYATLEPELALASDLAKKAGDAILEVRAHAIAFSSLKSDDSPVTAADLAADAVIREGLAATGDAIVTEETWKDGEIRKHERAWFVDPIDGTEDFIKQSRDYVVQIGLCVDGAPALGVLYQPETGLLWRGIVADRRCERVEAGRVLPRTVAGRALPAKPRIAISVSHPSAVVDFVTQQLGGVAVWRGSVGLKVALIVDDEADAYVTASQRIKVWDTCAPAAVLLAAGGVVTTLAGAPLAYEGPAAHTGGVCMWTPAARNDISSRVDEAVRRFRGRMFD